ncbi:MAG: ABC transporter ATP-binding protein [Chloroflexi bacterium]|nr:MAG: ABC transporter ATP-binding protein [Chloroflexota bacterium]
MGDSWQDYRRLAAYFPRVLGLIWQASPLYGSAALGLTLVGALAKPAQIWLMKVIVDRVTGLLSAGDVGTVVDWSGLAVPAALLFAVLIIGDVSASLAEHLQSLLGFQTTSFADGLILDKAARLDIAFYETPGFYDQLERAREGTWRVHNVARQSIGLVSHGLATLSTLALLATLHPLAAVVLVLVSIPNLVMKSRYAKRIFGLWNLLTPASRMVSYLSGLLVSRDAIKEVRLFGLQPLFLERFHAYWRTFLDEIRQILFAQERANLLVSTLSVMGAGAIWVYATVQTVAGRFTLGDLTLAFQAVEQARSGMASFFGMGGMYVENSLYLRNFFDFLSLPPSSVEGALPESSPVVEGKPRVPRPLRQGIELRNVSFRYPGATDFALRNLSFTIPPEQTVAIVGENGAGKSTLVKLLVRLYDPTEGEILLDGRDLREYDIADLQHTLGVIFQDFVRYHLSAQENIGFGQIEFAEDVARVQAAADKGGAAAFIEKLPKGYATLLGKTFEGSVDLSGGEWQKLALSRAFMREAQVLILDEPTAALDAIAEDQVYQRFAELSAGRMVLFVSHRFSTVRMARQILVLQDGLLTETGSHQELMVLNKHYAQMYNVQAERFR